MFCLARGIRRRGASKIVTCLYNDLDCRNVKQVFLFSDGCPGQNKNSGIATMLLHAVTGSKNLRTIYLKFFEPYHGQNEGDSAYSSINAALKVAGDVYVPSELKSIIRLSRRKTPYKSWKCTQHRLFGFYGPGQNTKGSFCATWWPRREGLSGGIHGVKKGTK